MTIKNSIVVSGITYQWANTQICSRLGNFSLANTSGLKDALKRVSVSESDAKIVCDWVQNSINEDIKKSQMQWASGIA